MDKKYEMLTKDHGFKKYRQFSYKNFNCCANSLVVEPKNLVVAKNEWATVFGPCKLRV